MKTSVLRNICVENTTIINNRAPLAIRQVTHEWSRKGIVCFTYIIRQQ